MVVTKPSYWAVWAIAITAFLMASIATP